MGVKGRAVLAVTVLLFVLGSMWLRLTPHRGFKPSMRLSDNPDGALDDHLKPCLNSYVQVHLPGNVSNGRVTGVIGEDTDSFTLSECPGQEFQVSRLLSHLRAAATPDFDVLISPYLSSWDELIKFLNALGPMVSLISQEIEGKTSIIRELARQEKEESQATREAGSDHLHSEVDGNRDEDRSSTVRSEGSKSYQSVRSMIEAELHLGLVDFQEQTDSGCRTLLRLHRALLWLQLFLQKLGESPPPGGRPRSPSELCREAYQETLAQHHSWLVRRAAEMAFMAMPERSYFFRLVCVHNQQGATLVLKKVVRAIGEVYTRTEAALEEHGMLNLP